MGFKRSRVQISLPRLMQFRASAIETLADGRQRFSGARLNGVQEVTGSSPVAPIICWSNLSTLSFGLAKFNEGITCGGVADISYLPELILVAVGNKDL